ncbi:MAG: EAL domain-containing protein [Martelella sp.]|uniref:EAL domain-containing protein n=1 Tax=Martelella sp. TaxID=1969699 RepID=UPI003242CA65
MPETCIGCRDGEALAFDFSMAFQPIIDLRDGAIFAYEALVRGTAGEGAASVLSKVTQNNLYAFDQRCRVKAIELAGKLGLVETGARLSINFMPRAIYEPRACIRLTLSASRRCGIPADRLIFEFTETEQIDAERLNTILRVYEELGFKAAIDDFGTGHSGLSMLADIAPSIIKLDMALVRDIDSHSARRTIVRHMLAMARDMSVEVVCEGVESAAELDTLAELGARLVQGYHFCRPLFERLAAPEEINGLG